MDIINISTDIIIKKQINKEKDREKTINKLKN